MLSVVLTYESPQKAIYYLNKELESRYDYFWEKKDGTPIRLKDMSTEHIINTIKKLKQNMYEREIIQENYIDALDYYD